MPDRIVSHPATQEYRDNYDRVFGKKAVTVEIPFADWINPLPKHEGERIVWSDGSAHSLPELDTSTVVVLRLTQRAKVERSVYGVTQNKTRGGSKV